MVGQNYQLPDRLLLINKTMNMDFTTALNFTLNIPVTVDKVWSMNWTFTACNERYKADEWYDISYDRNKWFGLVSMNHTWTLLKAPLLTLNVDGFYNLDMDYTKFRRSFMLTFTYKFKGYQEKQTKQVDSSRFGF